MTDNQESRSGDEKKLPERPIECGGCKKAIAVKYTEIIGQQITHTSMCADCPLLDRRLHGTPTVEKGKFQWEGSAGLACGNCGTTLEALRLGSTLGCNECYEVFGDVIINDLLKEGKVPVRIATTKKTTPIHIGRAPGESQEINPSLRLIALNEALRETLKREDYEQAAMLRDQIKELTEKEGDSNAES